MAEVGNVAGFCDHCAGQRFDRAQVLRALRRIRKDLRGRRSGKKVDEAIALALKTVVRLELPHLDVEDMDDAVVH